MNPRVYFILLSFCISVVVSYFISPFANGNKDAINALVTTFTVFGGFLIGVMTLTGDANSTGAGSWRSAESNRRRIDGPLARQRALFYLYLLVLILLVSSLLIIEPSGQHNIEDSVKIWLTRSYMALAIFAILLTLTLPQMLVNAQRNKLDKQVEEKRNVEGIRTGEKSDDPKQFE